MVGVWLDRRCDSDADPVDADRPRLSLGSQSEASTEASDATESAGLPARSPRRSSCPIAQSLGVRQGLTTQLTLARHGRMDRMEAHRHVDYHSVERRARPCAVRHSRSTVPFQWNDGWFYSVGLEYVATPTWTFRGGVGFEKSPITDQVRIPLLPDNDRTWYSVGATNKVTNIISVDLAYSFVDVKNTTDQRRSRQSVVQRARDLHRNLAGERQHLLARREVQARRTSPGGRYPRIAGSA